jgi:hypothetical protein
VQSGPKLTRRSLVGLAVLVVAGCKSKTPKQPPRPVVVPDADALVEAKFAERTLLVSYDAAIDAAPLRNRAPLQVQRAIHATHLAALHAPTRLGGPPLTAVTSIERALATSARNLRAFAVDATSGANAALFASIAASHEVSAGELT